MEYGNIFPHTRYILRRNRFLYDSDAANERLVQTTQPRDNNQRGVRDDELMFTVKFELASGEGILFASQRFVKGINSIQVERKKVLENRECAHKHVSTRLG